MVHPSRQDFRGAKRAARSCANGLPGMACHDYLVARLCGCGVWAVRSACNHQRLGDWTGRKRGGPKRKERVETESNAQLQRLQRMILTLALVAGDPQP